MPVRFVCGHAANGVKGCLENNAAIFKEKHVCKVVRTLFR